MSHGVSSDKSHQKRLCPLPPPFFPQHPFTKVLYILQWQEGLRAFAGTPGRDQHEALESFSRAQPMAPLLGLPEDWHAGSCTLGPPGARKASEQVWHCALISQLGKQPYLAVLVFS